MWLREKPAGLGGCKSPDVKVTSYAFAKLITAYTFIVLKTYLKQLGW